MPERRPDRDVDAAFLGLPPGVGEGRLENS